MSHAKQKLLRLISTRAVISFLTPLVGLLAYLAITEPELLPSVRPLNLVWLASVAGFGILMVWMIISPPQPERQQ
jgi:hypothetical protein